VRKVKGYQCTRVLSVSGGVPQPPPPAKAKTAKAERPTGWRVRAWLKSFSHDNGRGTMTVFDSDGDLEFVQLIAIGAVKKGEEAFVSREVFAEAGIFDIAVGQIYVCEIVREPGHALEPHHLRHLPGRWNRSAANRHETAVRRPDFGFTIGRKCVGRRTL